MNKPLMAIAALVGAGGLAASAYVVGSSGGEEEFVQQVESPTLTVSASTRPNPSISPGVTATPIHEPTPAATATANPSSSPANTITYTDPTYGYSFEYPADWFVIAPTTGPDTVAATVSLFSFDPKSTRQIGGPSQSQLKIDFGVTTNPEGLSPQEWLAQIDSESQDDVAVVSESPATIDNEQGIERVHSIHGRTSSHVLARNKSYVYTISTYPADSSLREVGSHILSTFRFSP